MTVPSIDEPMFWVIVFGGVMAVYGTIHFLLSLGILLLGGKRRR